MVAVSLDVFVETHRETGKPFIENLLVEPLGDDTYRLLCSPGFLQGLAAGDTMTWDRESKRVSLVKRAGNICIQYFATLRLAEIESYIAGRLPELQGRIDGSYENRLLVLTMPAAVGFTAIEALIEEVESRFGKSQWQYGNVYDPVDGSPLNWWNQ